jgi:hypothetical protein
VTLYAPVYVCDLCRARIAVRGWATDLDANAIQTPPQRIWHTCPDGYEHHATYDDWERVSA